MENQLYKLQIKDIKVHKPKECQLWREQNLRRGDGRGIERNRQSEVDLKTRTYLKYTCVKAVHNSVMRYPSTLPGLQANTQIFGGHVF